MTFYSDAGKIQAGLLMVISTFTIFSCKTLPEPAFSFTPLENPEAGMTIFFSNESLDATTLAWEFGDGGTSNLENPEYIYQSPGTYKVNLTAANADGEASKNQAITITQPTILGFQIFDSTGMNLISGMDVWLYDTEDDLLNIREPKFSEVTNDMGEVRFHNMKPMEYYFLAVKSVPGGSWFFAYSTPPLDQNEENIFWFNCIWFPEGKKSALQPDNYLNKSELDLFHDKLSRK